MTKRTLTIGGVVVVLVVAVVVGWFMKGGVSIGTAEQAVSTASPVDTVFDFYDRWLVAASATSTDPYAEGLADTPYLSAALRSRLADAQGQPATDPDPVLCQVSVPEQLSARPVFMSEDQAQVLVRSAAAGSPEQAVVTLVGLNGGWYIDDIACSAGEFAPEREFDFAQEGFLLKSVVAPLDPQYWHLVFEQGGERGHTAQLFFDAQSTCVAPDGTESVCNPDSFTEPAKAYVAGSATEAGIQVKRVELKG